MKIKETIRKISIGLSKTWSVKLIQMGYFFSGAAIAAIIFYSYVVYYGDSLLKLFGAAFWAGQVLFFFALIIYISDLAIFIAEGGLREDGYNGKGRRGNNKLP